MAKGCPAKSSQLNGTGGLPDLLTQKGKSISAILAYGMLPGSDNPVLISSSAASSKSSRSLRTASASAAAFSSAVTEGGGGAAGVLGGFPGELRLGLLPPMRHPSGVPHALIECLDPPALTGCGQRDTRSVRSLLAVTTASPRVPRP